MNVLTQDLVIAYSEDSRIKRESTVNLLDSTHLVDSSFLDRVSSPCESPFIDAASPNDTKLVKTFPWITEFSKKCQAEIGLTRIHSLENLMKDYILHVSAAAQDCHLKPKRSAKLKKNLNGTLLLFHLFYSDIKKPFEHSTYLDKMSDLMAMYIDMEITASCRSKESLFKISSKLTSSLLIFLDRSYDHILDTIFKTKNMNKNYFELCNLIFSRVLRESPGRAVCNLTYVRYVLAFKMWMRVVKGIEEKRTIMKLASTKLHPPLMFRESIKAGAFSGILPKIPKSRNDITMFLMQAKFPVKEKIKEFLKQISMPRKQGIFSSFMTNFNRVQFSNDTDDSRLSSEEDQEEDRGSTALINNIWSSMSSDSGVAHQIRMASIIKGNKLKKKCKKTKCKGIATPVFKSNNSQTCDSVEKLKKKRRLQQMSELAAIKPLSTSLITEKCSNQTNITMVRPRIEPSLESTLQVANVESCQSLSTITIKDEPEDSERNLDPVKSSDLINTVDSVASAEITDTICSTEADNKKPELTCSNQVWKDRGRTPCEPLSRTVSRLVSQPIVQTKDNSVQFERPPQEVTVVTNLINFSQVSQSSKDSKQDFNKKTVEISPESGRNFHKSHTKPTKPCGDQRQESSCKSESDTVQEKFGGILHDQTLRRDFMIFTSQHMFRTNLLNNSVLPETTVPSPYSNGGSEETVKRCNCSQCTANQTALITNYKTLTQYLETQQMVVAASSSSDQNQDSETSSCLPFKKRKTLSVGKEEDEQDGKAISSDSRDYEVSYPNTPMISIAMIDPKVQAIASSTNTSSLLPPAIDYSQSSTSVNCNVQPNPFIHSSVEQLVSSNTATRVEQTPSFTLVSQTVHTTGCKPKFKTPAQLKECPIPRDSLAAQTVPCPTNSKRRTNVQSCPRWAPSPKKSKSKGKVETRNLRKRK